MSVNNKMQFVLHGGEKGADGRRIFILANSGGIDVGNFLIELAFTEPDFPDFFKQALKVVFVKDCTVLQTFPVQHIAPGGKLSQNLRGSLTELCGSYGVDLVAHGK